MLFSFTSHPGLRDALARVWTCVGATMMLIGGVAHAQHNDAAPAATATPATMADRLPSNSSAVDTGKPLIFDSLLTRYKPMTDQKLGSWREANDTVTQIGGWRAYLKEAQAPGVTENTATAAPAALPASPAITAPDPLPGVSPAPNPHNGHGAKR